MNKPLDLAIVTGFGDKGISELQKELNRELQPATSRVIASAPWYRAHHHPEEVIAEVTKELDAQPGNHLLVGHSYGALIALVVACRRELDGILKLILLDGPLRSDVEVKPAKTAHHLFFRHYRERVKLAEECEEVLQRLATDKILTIATAKDAIVPPESKKLATNPVQARLTSAESAASYTPVTDGGVNITIDIPKMHGHGLSKAKAELYGRIIKNML